MKPVPQLSQEHRAALDTQDWFASLPREEREHVLSRGRQRSLVPGQRIFSRGDEPDGIYVVLEGCVRVSGISLEGRETVLDFYGPGSWFGEVSTLDDGPRGHDAEAYEHALLLHFGKSVVEELLSGSTAFARGLLRLEAQRLRILFNALESYSTQTLEQRLANRLLMLADRYGVTTPHGVKLELHLSQETLGRLIGSTRQRVNQIFHEWEAAGIIEQQYGRILLLDTVRLEEMRKL